jgi:crotonobetainyl-CoA:carnitine CoA-transferase CaiB-like acyl-CoA transferase
MAPNLQSNSELPLAGITVLDATSNIAGPFGGSILGDLGAEVIKIETPFLDAARMMSPTEDDRSAYFHVVNRNKTAVTIDLKSESDRAVLEKLLDSADVFLSNFLPEKLDELNLSAAELMRTRPNLIVGNLSSYGSIGPASKFPGYDATVQARTGVMHVTGEADGGPVRAGVSVLDVGSGMWLAMGILAALYKRTQTGQGSVIETSLYETGVMWVSYHLSAYQLTNNASVRSGSGHPAFAPYGLFLTADDQIMIGVGNDKIFARLCNCINRPDLITNPLFTDNVSRVKNSKQLQTELENTLKTNSSQHWVEILGANSVPADRVVKPEEVLTDPQAQATGMLVDYPDPSSKVTKLPGLPIRINGSRPLIRMAAPHQDKKN